MDNDIKAWLYDILNAIAEIESFFNNEPKEFAKYQNDLRTRRAVERNMYPLHQPLVFLQIIRVHLWRYGFKNNGTDNAGSYCIV